MIQNRLATAIAGLHCTWFQNQNRLLLFWFKLEVNTNNNVHPPQLACVISCIKSTILTFQNIFFK